MFGLPSGKGDTMATSVFYDFSIVAKARFFVYTKGGRKKDGKSVECLKVHPDYPMLPVQINPTDITIKRSNTGRNEPLVPAVEKYIRQKDTISFDLEYDIYDMYNVGTQDGAFDFGQISLENKSTTSFKVLRDEIFPDPNCYLWFVWGEVKFFGQLTKFSPSMRTFSRWGTPLKATVQVEMTCPPLGTDGMDPKEVTYDLMSSAIYANSDAVTTTVMKSLGKAEVSTKKALFAVSQSLR